MPIVVSSIAQLLGYIIRLCYLLANNFGLAILLFVLFSKIILAPLSVWVHRNSIKLVQMQPAVNWLKVRLFGDKDAIAEEQAKIFKQYHYNPLASIIPLIIQILLLLGMVEVINHPLRYLLSLPEDLIQALVNLTGTLTGKDIATSSAQLAVIHLVGSGTYENAFSALGVQFSAVDMQGVLAGIRSIHLDFLFMNLAWVPMQTGGVAFVIPVIAAFSSWLLSYAQNRSQVLQAEQGNLSKYGLMIFSVVLSLYLGLFVTAGIAIYWTASNLLAIVQMYILNAAIPPQKFVNYADLENSRAALSVLKQTAGGNTHKRPFAYDANAKRERADYKRFFSIANKHLVFYSEKSGFYKYYEGVIEYLLAHSNVTIHYVTSDLEDIIFAKAKEYPKIKPYYIGERKLITLMMKMDADMVVMTMPDLDNFHIKRSYVRKDINYVYMYHGITNSHMVARKGCFDHYDTILCVGPHQVQEIRETEQRYDLPAKKLIQCGYPLIEKLSSDYMQRSSLNHEHSQIIIAPSWQENNIMDSCLDAVVPPLIDAGYDVILRPHPEYIKRYPQRVQAISDRYASKIGCGFHIQMDFISDVYDADLLVTDWSTVAYEYCFTALKPVLFINTPAKVLNDEYVHYKLQPVDISWRSEVGQAISMDNLDNISEKVSDLLGDKQQYREKLIVMREHVLFNYGRSAAAGGQYLLDALIKRSKNES